MARRGPGDPCAPGIGRGAGRRPTLGAVSWRCARVMVRRRGQRLEESQALWQALNDQAGMACVLA